MTNRINEIRKFLETEIESIRGVAGFIAGFLKNWIIDDNLVETIGLHINDDKKIERLIAYTTAEDRNSENNVCLVATSLGIYAFSSDDYTLDYFIEYSNISSLDCSREGIFEAKYVMSIFMAGKKNYGWFFESPVKSVLEDFVSKVRVALVSHESIENTTTTDDSTSNEDLINRINELYNKKLISKKDRDLKIRYLP